MKKIIYIFIIIMIGSMLLVKEKEIIPKESIRLRIIASSNEKNDQTIKKEIANKLIQEIGTHQKKSIAETRDYMISSLPTFEELIKNTLEENQKEKDFQIHYGMNYFPKKEYKNVIYEEGEYESLVVTIGKGKGKNYWCVLFPPLCFVDEDEEIEYKSFFKEIIDKYF